MRVSCTTTRRPALTCIVLSSLLALTGCNRRTSSASSAESDLDPGSPTPMDTARMLRSLYAKQKYRLMDPLIAPDRRVVLIDTLMAMDRLFAVNERSQRRITLLHGERVASEFDLGGLADDIGLFSRNVELRGERIDGDGAVVLAQVSNRLPLDEFRFVRLNNRWLYAPEAPLPSLPKLLNDLASGLEMLTFQLERNEYTVEQIRSDFHHRVFRRMNKIGGSLLTSQPTTAATRPSR